MRRLWLIFAQAVTAWYVVVKMLGRRMVHVAVFVLLALIVLVL